MCVLTLTSDISCFLSPFALFFFLIGIIAGIVYKKRASVPLGILFGATLFFIGGFLLTIRSRGLEFDARLFLFSSLFALGFVVVYLFGTYVYDQVKK